MEEGKLSFTRFTSSVGGKIVLPSDDVRALYKDNKGIIWIGTANGFVTYNPETGKSEIPNLNNLLPNKIINGMLQDASDNYWISTNKGLICFNPVKNKVELYNKSDGLQGDEFNYTSLFKNKETGELFFGGTNGLNMFQPGDIMHNTSIPDVKCTRLFVRARKWR